MEVRVKEYATLDSNSMVDYWTVIRKKYASATKIHIILDQGSYNTSQITRQEAEKMGIELHYLPPYSPNLNPIERLWKIMNEQVRNNQYFLSVKHFKDAILAFFNESWDKLASHMISRINDNFQILQNPPSQVC